jgi:hypothetical protein
MMFTIIEDCSPYYIRFTHEGAEKVPNECVKFVSGYEFQKKFTHYKYPIDQANQILDNTHMKNLFNFDIGRVSLFVTQPGFYYRPHKDGPNHRFSINYTVKILDNNCETSWYSDEELKDYPIDYLGGRSREALGFIKENHKPVKSMVATQGEIILFNTDIFHDFDNRNSLNERMVLTLRVQNPGTMYFEDAKKILFGGLAQLGER